MSFDPVIAFVITLIAILIGYVVYLYRDSSSNATFSLSEDEVTALLESDIDMSLYDGHLPEKEKYLKLQEELGDSWQNDTAKSKQLQSALLKRAIYVLEKALKINDASEKLRGLSTTQMIPKSLNNRITTGVAKVESEFAEVKQEAERVRTGWSNVIFNQAADLSVGLQNRKAARQEQQKQQQQQGQQQQQPQQQSVKKQENSAAMDETKQKKLEAEAERNFQRLMQEEERRAKKEQQQHKQHNKKKSASN